jgi:hypothetical protein
MKRYLVIALFGAAFAVAAGFISLHGISATPLLIAESANTEKTGMLGHITYIVTDPNGHVKQYLQTDNLVVDKGRNCATTLLFNSSATTSCTVPARTSTTNGFNWISIGNSTSGGVSNTNTTLNTGGTNVQTKTAQAPAVFQATSSAGSQAIETLSKTFTFVASNATTIRDSGLFDASSSGNMFAHQVLAPTVTVGNGDSLTVKWTINVG